MPATVGAKGHGKQSLAVLMHLSHEIRTPLNSMLALSQLLRDGMAGALNSEQQKYIEVIERNGRNLIRLVTEVLDLSRLQSGHVDVEMRSLDLRDQLRATAADLAPLAVAKGLGLAVDVFDELPAVRCDPERLRQVLTNLIGNAIKFTDRGRVTVAAERRGALVVVHVSDTGVGISETDLPRLFDEFFQVEGGASTRRREGAGLGLTISRRLVRLMGGELSVQSAPGVGSCFTFTMPVAEKPERIAGAGRSGARFQDEPHGTNTAGR